MTSLGWKELPLGDVADIRVSNVDKRSVSGELPVRLCNYLDVYQQPYLTEDRPYMAATAAAAEVERFGLRAGDVLITKDSETPDDIAIPAVVDRSLPNLVCGYHLAILRPSPGVDPTWLAKQLAGTSAKRYFGCVATGSTRYGLSNAAIARFPVALPPIKEQNHAAGILRTLDEAIRKTEQLIDKLKQVKRGLLHDLLTRGIDESGELRDLERHPELFKDSQLGRIPADWALSTLGTVADVDRGKFGHRPRNDPAFYGGPFPFIQTGDITGADGGVLKTFSQTLNERGRSVSREFPAGSIAITIAANIADTALLGLPMYFPDSVVGAVVHAPHVPRFVELCIRRAKQGLDARAPQSAQKNINLQDLRPLPIPVPSQAEQQRIAACYDAATLRIDQEGRALDKLRVFRLGLGEDLLTGRVRVTNQDTAA